MKRTIIVAWLLIAALALATWTALAGVYDGRSFLAVFLLVTAFVVSIGGKR